MLACLRGTIRLNVNTRASYIKLDIEQRERMVLVRPHGTSSFAMASLFMVCVSNNNGNIHNLDVSQYSEMRD